MKRTQFVLALALAGSMGSAAAMGPGYLGDLVGQSVSIGNTLSGLGTSIADIYSFDIGKLTSEVIATSVKVKLKFGSSSTPVYDISNFAITLKDINGTIYGADNTFDSSGALNLSVTLPPSAVAAPGFYHFMVSGITAGTAGGIYASALSAAPVPEPETWLMLLAGLGVVGMMVGHTRRRRNSALQ